MPPGMGTDGKPMPPDPSLSGPFGMHPGTAQPPGGGVMQSPPAAANGSPAPMMVTLPYLMATAARAGYDPTVVKLLGTSWINQQIATGAMDRATGERFLSGAGDSAPLQATTTLTTTAMNNADKSTDPTAQASLLRESVDKFRNALIKDPYNAAATLKLARAYDSVYRKGCALAMLKRLATLAANPKFARTANAEIDSIGDNGQWFKHYRKDAMTAVGR